MCQVFHNKMKHKLKEKEDTDRSASSALSNRDDGETSNGGNDSTDDDIDNDIIDDSDNELPCVFLEENIRGTEAQGRLQDYIRQFINLVEDAKTHVEQVADQRVFSNHKINQAIADTIEGRPHSDCTRTIVMDYSQNAQVPQPGSDQPGSDQPSSDQPRMTYYFSLLRVYSFGIVHCGTPGGELDAYLCHEGQCAKGGNNGALLLYLYLLKIVWLQSDNAGKELKAVMDNCCGQNKNNFVLWLAPLLLEAGYFKKVNFILYIAGHTKIHAITSSTR